MSATLLQRIKEHIVDDGGFLGGYGIRYYRWMDSDLNGSGSIALFRMSGLSGEVNRQVQFNDVSLYLLADPDQVKQADDDLLAVLQYLRANPETTGAFNIFPEGSFTGPSYLQNNRAMFEMVLRTGTEDH